MQIKLTELVRFKGKTRVYAVINQTFEAWIEFTDRTVTDGTFRIGSPNSDALAQQAMKVI